MPYESEKVFLVVSKDPIHTLLSFTQYLLFTVSTQFFSTLFSYSHRNLGFFAFPTFQAKAEGIDREKVSKRQA